MKKIRVGLPLSTIPEWSNLEIEALTPPLVEITLLVLCAKIHSSFTKRHFEVSKVFKTHVMYGIQPDLFWNVQFFRVKNKKVPKNKKRRTDNSRKMIIIIILYDQNTDQNGLWSFTYLGTVSLCHKSNVTCHH